MPRLAAVVLALWLSLCLLVGCKSSEPAVERKLDVLLRRVEDLEQRVDEVGNKVDRIHAELKQAELAGLPDAAPPPPDAGRAVIDAAPAPDEVPAAPQVPDGGALDAAR